MSPASIEGPRTSGPMLMLDEHALLADRRRANVAHRILKVLAT